MNQENALQKKNRMTKNDTASTEVFHWTIEQYHRLAEANILTNDDKTELLNGQIIYINPIGKLHAATVRRLDKLLQKILGDTVLISTQNPISIFFMIQNLNLIWFF